MDHDKENDFWIFNQHEKYRFALPTDPWFERMWIFALSFALGKEPLENNSELANQASKVFWETLHQGDYNNISKTMTLLKAAYLQNPYDAKIAARIGFLHAWSLTERQRLKNIPPQITDNAILARKYFEEAVRLNPEDARYLGFHSSMMMSEGSIHKDVYLTRKG